MQNTLTTAVVFQETLFLWCKEKIDDLIDAIQPMLWDKKALSDLETHQ